MIDSIQNCEPCLLCEESLLITMQCGEKEFIIKGYLGCVGYYVNHMTLSTPLCSSFLVLENGLLQKTWCGPGLQEQQATSAVCVD